MTDRPDFKDEFDRRVDQTLEAARRRRLYAIHDAVPEIEPEPSGRHPKAVEGGSGPDARRAGSSDGSLIGGWTLLAAAFVLGFLVAAVVLR